MQINLKGHIVILDEAHNIEDICRDAASVHLKNNDLRNAAEDCEYLAKKRPNYRQDYRIIHKYLMDIITFIENIILKDNVSVIYRVIDFYVSILLSCVI